MSARVGIVGTMAVGAVVAVTSFGAPGGAQSDATTEIAHPGFDFAPAISDDGRTIVFASSPTADGSMSSIHLHDRGATDADGNALPATTTLLSDSLGATNPAISGNGCIVTWSVPPVAPQTPVGGEIDGGPQAQPATSTDSDPAAPSEPVDALQATDARVVVLDRCTDPSPDRDEGRVDLPLGDDDVSFGRAVPSVDGSVIAVSNGTDVVRFALDADGAYRETHRFDGSDDPNTDHLVADGVDVSDDGSVVVFAGGPDLSDVSSTTVFTHVTEDDEATTTAVLSAATTPSVSGDGTLVLASTGSQSASVKLVDRTTIPLAPVDLGPGRRPTISADGNHVVFEDDAELVVVSRTGGGDQPYATTQRTPLSSTVAPTRSGPVVDRLGRTVASDLTVGDPSPPIDIADTDIAVTDIGADASFDAALFDLGGGAVGAVLTSKITFSNRGPASIGVERIAVGPPFTITADRCGPVVRPGARCEVDVSLTVEIVGETLGEVTLVSTSFGDPAFVTEVRALGEATPVTIPPTSPPRTSPPRTSPPRTIPRGSSTGGSGTTTTTTEASGAGVTASPAAFDFAPTIIDAGRRTGLVEIVNQGSGAVTVSEVRLEPAGAGPFEIVETTCTGESVAVGSRCGITLAFAPTAVGAQNVTVIASLASGADITAIVSGTGAPAPTLEVNPGVATIGQVVTLSGSGFPTGITVEVTWASSVHQVVVDDAGTFNLPVVVMAYTSTGPVEVSVAGQTDLFAAVTGSLLVTDTSDRSRPAVIRGIGPSIGR